MRRFGFLMRPGAYAHGAGTFVPPTYRLRCGVQRFGLAASVPFAMRLRLFRFAIRADTRGILLGVMPPPVPCGHTGKGPEGADQQCGAESENWSLHGQYSPLFVFSMRHETGNTVRKYLVSKLDRGPWPAVQSGKNLLAALYLRAAPRSHR